MLELRGLILFVKHLVRRRYRSCRILVGLNSRVVLGEAEKGRSSSTSLNFHIRRLAEVCVTYELTLTLFCLPTWGDPADEPSRLTSLKEWKEHFPAVVVKWDDLQPTSPTAVQSLHTCRRRLARQPGVRLALGGAWVISRSSLPWIAALRVGLRSSAPAWLSEMVKAGRRSHPFRAQCARGLRVLRPWFLMWDPRCDTTLPLLFWELCLECALADIPIYFLADPGARLWKEANLMELADAAGLYEGHLACLVAQGDGCWARRALASDPVCGRRCPVVGSSPRC